VHEKILDTSVLYPHPLGLPYKKSLRELSARYLKCFIQQNQQDSSSISLGHDSYEDAAASMSLVQLKLAKGKE